MRKKLRQLRCRSVRAAEPWGYCSEDDDGDGEGEDEAVIGERIKAARAEPGRVHRFEPQLRQLVAAGEGAEFGGSFINAIIRLCARAGNCASTSFWVSQASSRCVPLTASCRRAALECFEAQMEDEIQQIDAAQQAGEEYSEDLLRELEDLAESLDRFQADDAQPCVPGQAEHCGRRVPVFTVCCAQACRVGWVPGRRPGQRRAL